MSEQNNNCVELGADLFVAYSLLMHAQTSDAIPSNVKARLSTITTELNSVRSDCENFIEKDEDGCISPKIFYPNATEDLGPVLMAEVDESIKSYMKRHPEYHE